MDGGKIPPSKTLESTKKHLVSNVQKENTGIQVLVLTAMLAHTEYKKVCAPIAP